MLTILNSLAPFIEDADQEIHVRAYAKQQGISPPTDAKLLKSLERENLLEKRIDKGHHCYRAVHSPVYKDLCKLYWREQLEPFIKLIKKTHIAPTIILFSSLAKGNARKESDIDIAIFAPSHTQPEIQAIETKLQRKFHIFFGKKPEDITNPRLLANIREGYYLEGTWSDVEFLAEKATTNPSARNNQ